MGNACKTSDKDKERPSDMHDRPCSKKYVPGKVRFTKEQITQQEPPPPNDKVPRAVLEEQLAQCNSNEDEDRNAEKAGPTQAAREKKPDRADDGQSGADRDGEPPPVDVEAPVTEKHADAAPAEKGLAEPSAEERGRGDTDQQLTADEIAGAGGAEQAPIILQLLCLDVISPLPLQQKKYTGPAIFGKGCGCPTDQEVPAPSVEEQEDTGQQLDPHGDAGTCGAEQAPITPQLLCLDGTEWEGIITIPGDMDGDYPSKQVENRLCQLEFGEQQQLMHGFGSVGDKYGRTKYIVKQSEMQPARVISREGASLVWQTEGTVGWEEKAEKVEYTCRGQLSRWLCEPYWRLHGEVLVEGKDEIGSFECWLTKGDAVFGLEEADAARQEERARSSSMLLAAALTAEDEAAREADLQVRCFHCTLESYMLCSSTVAAAD